MIVQANTGSEIDAVYGFKILGLRTEMKPFWTGSMFDYHGRPLPDYNHASSECSPVTTTRFRSECERGRCLVHWFDNRPRRATA